MSEEARKPNDGGLLAEQLKAAITERGESTLADIIAAARGFKKELAERAGTESGGLEAEKDEPSAQSGEMQSGMETVEYRPPAIVRAAESALEQGAARKSPAERRSEVKSRTARRHGSALFGRSRSEQLDIIRRLSDEAAEELPERFYEKLSGGISLSDTKKYHPRSRNERPLLILGEYRNDPRLGRSIMLYGGSIIATYSHLSESELQNELRRIIRHEFTHHIESLCGERGLEIEDEVSLARYEWEISEGKKDAHRSGEEDDCR
ncbi:MAG: hypothetical protein IKZ82_02655 [Clostridia bacterium]|nr:hypothetical protein [Clostridia bacterium]